MGSYREQLLKETYGTGRNGIYGTEEEPGGAFTMFKLKFMICVFLFAGFLWLSRTGGSIFQMNAEQIVSMISEDQITQTIEQLSLYEPE